ncbi:hypothetical protein [Nonomuraea glycinis]|uniref:hypothetical protein n=1 Tax=Nonomuraea glycinis TaxID=2047744 RepID=UPI002E142FE8|nr:hypothetical protein OHA68_15780 [Nonomuraea glycinis]
MPFNLDALDPSHVAGHTVLKADLGVGGRHLLVISGFALPAWKIDDDSTHREVCRVRLRVPAGTVEQSTVHVGLASIANDDTEYVFATDEARLDVDDAGELVLVTHLALMGEPSILNRFSYQVVLTTRVVVTEITGTISWPTAWFRPTSAGPAGVSGVFGVMANERTTTQAGPPLGGEIEHLRPVTPGEIVSVTIAEDTCRATYRISEPPKGMQLKVTVKQNGLNGPGEISIAPVVPDGDRMTLSVAQPSRTGVDFIASSFVGPG